MYITRSWGDLLAATIAYNFQYDIRTRSFYLLHLLFMDSDFNEDFIALDTFILYSYLIFNFRYYWSVPRMHTDSLNMIISREVSTRSSSSLNLQF